MCERERLFIKFHDKFCVVLFESFKSCVLVYDS